MFIGIPRGEECLGTLHLLFTTLHLSVWRIWVSSYASKPRNLVPRWRVVKSGWRVADNSSPLETPCLWAFQGIRWRVKSFWRNRSKPRLPFHSWYFCVVSSEIIAKIFGGYNYLSYICSGVVVGGLSPLLTGDEMGIFNYLCISFGITATVLFAYFGNEILKVKLK